MELSTEHKLAFSIIYHLDPEPASPSYVARMVGIMLGRREQEGRWGAQLCQDLVAWGLAQRKSRWRYAKRPGATLASRSDDPIAPCSCGTTLAPSVQYRSRLVAIVCQASECRHESRALSLTDVIRRWNETHTDPFPHLFPVTPGR